MPQNPALFPPAFSQCPGTQTQEVDETIELRRQILALRYQYLLGIKRSGQSLAELQNQSIRVGNSLPGVIATSAAILNPANPKAPAVPVVNQSASRCYLAGAKRNGVYGFIDKFFFYQELVAQLSARLQTHRHRHGGTASAQKGYWAGGRTLQGNTALSTGDIEALTFQTERQAAIGATLSSVRYYLRAAASTRKAYFAGSYAPMNGSIEVLDFATETRSVLAASLPSVAAGPACCQSSRRGYFAGGVVSSGGGLAYSTAINFLNFATEATGNLSTTLSRSRMTGGGFASPSKGYFAGGLNALFAATRSIDVMPFSSEACTTLAATLKYPNAEIDGSSSRRKGYTFGGMGNVQTFASPGLIESLDFTSETQQAVGVRLSGGGRNSAAVRKL
jgi:hypothetical protein